MSPRENETNYAVKYTEIALGIRIERQNMISFREGPNYKETTSVILMEGNDTDDNTKTYVVYSDGNVVQLTRNDAIALMHNLDKFIYGVI